MIAEMLGDGLKSNSMLKYLNTGFWGQRIICIRRNPIYDSTQIRTFLNDRIITDLQRTIGYDHAGIVEYVWPNIKDQPYLFYCSEYLDHHAILDGNPIVGTKKYDDDISPYGIQIAPNLFTIKDWKM
jgi:hypothetical protein